MKKLLLSIMLVAAGINYVTAAEKFDTKKLLKKIYKSVFTLKTFDSNGTLIGSSTGFFVGENGEALSCFAPFSKASRAVVIDYSGKEYEVDMIFGADETYDVAKFHVNTTKTNPLSQTSAEVPDSTTIIIIPYNGKQASHITGELVKHEVFKEQYKYYTLKISSGTNNVGAPIVNTQGELIGILQESLQTTDSICYAIDTHFANSLKVNGLSINDPVLKSTSIKKALPEDIDQAVLSLYLGSGSMDSLSYAVLVEDFIKKFPASQEGYLHRAQISYDANMFEDCDNQIRKAFEVAEEKDAVHNAYAKLIFSKVLYKNDKEYEQWTIEKAIEQADMAYKTNPQPIYKQLKAEMLFSQTKYQESFETFQQIIESHQKTPEIYLQQAKCKEMLNDTLGTIALLDSAVNTFSKPYLKEAAPYLLARAQSLANNRQYRKAMVDYNEYEKLMSGKLNANFYYTRYITELNGRLFQQALHDIDKAISMSENEPLYYAEKASLLIRVNLIDEAEMTAKQCIAISPSNSDGYLFLGYAQCLKGNKPEGIANLKKAKELGDNQAQNIIDRFSK